MPSPKISICIASYNMRKLLVETIDNCLHQDYLNMEIIVWDDCSTDNTESLFDKNYEYRYIKYYRGKTNLGVGGAFNEAIKFATGEIVVLMCADDLFLNGKVLSDIALVFHNYPSVGHVSRWYTQFISDYPGPVRAWRTDNPIIQANNPSGLAFRREALEGCKCSNSMFVETSTLVKQVLDKWGYHILKYDTIGARVHQSTSTQKGYWLKRRVSSPAQDWYDLGARDILKDYCSFIQIKNGFTMKALIEEIGLFVKLRPVNLIMPMFWFFALVSLLTPRFILREIPKFWRLRIGRLITKEIKRQ